MITFLPYPDFNQIAMCLDQKRLGQQRREALSILRALLGHVKMARIPILIMWEGYENALCNYGEMICWEWRHRGFKDNLLKEFEELYDSDKALTMPPWLGDNRVHSSHRARLLSKDPHWYGAFGWNEQPSEFYWYPTNDPSNQVRSRASSN